MKHEVSQEKHMHNKYLNVVLMLSLLAPLGSPAADWALIKKNKDYELQVDMDSYNETADMPFITSKTQFNRPQYYQLNDKKLSFVEQHTTIQFNCKLNTFKVLITHFYAKKNALTASDNEIKSFKPLVKGSDVAAISSLVCQVHQMVGGT